MDENKQSLRALEGKNPKPLAEEKGEEEDEEFDEYGDSHGDDDEQRRLSELENALRRNGAETRGTESKKLSVGSSVELSESDLLPDFVASSHELSEVPVEYNLQPEESIGIKDQVGAIRHGGFANVTAQAVLAEARNQIQSSGSATASPELSPTSVTCPVACMLSPTPVEQKLPLEFNGDSACALGGQKNSSGCKTTSTVPMLKASSSDGYNWRKYGQKQVKSPQGSRSYYKCNCSDCSAKKIECCNYSNCITEIIYRGLHNHDPPRKTNATRESRLALSVPPIVGCNIPSNPLRTFTNSESSSSSKESPTVPEANRQILDGCDRNIEIDVEEEHFEEPETKRRMKKSGPANLGSPCKPGKKPKIVVHAAGDVGVSGDGYRWRKYGQKMVKGNPHPRNYYRCTSAGCPVRKHIERAVDSTTAIIITYKGRHDHDMPVPKKWHGQPSAPLVAAAAPASMNSLQDKRTDAHECQAPAAKWSVDTEGELTGEALDLGGKKAMDSARALLSIGFEIKPY